MAILRPLRLYKDIDLAFGINPATKDLNKKLDINAVKQSMKALLFTHVGERLFQPDVGSTLQGLLFEPIDPITSHALKASIENVIQNYEPRIRLNEVQVVPQYEKNEYEISIYFTVIGIPTPVTFTTILQRLR